MLGWTLLYFFSVLLFATYVDLVNVLCKYCIKSSICVQQGQRPCNLSVVANQMNHLREVF